MSTKKLVYLGIFAALVLVSTWMIKIPIPTGYIHLGDAMVYLSGALLGPIGALAAGLGSLLADIMAGYASYALPTFVIKSLDALMVAVIFKGLAKKSDSGQVELVKLVGAMLVGGAVMVSGYFAYELFVAPEYAFVNIPFNVIQASSGVVIAALVYPFIARFKGDIQSL